jgi:alkane 1-monooxygenase
VTGRVEYRDNKRWAWLLSVVFPLLPFLGMAAHAASGWQIALALPLVISYGLMPLLDWLIGEDLNNPPEAVVPQLEADRYYRWLTWAIVPLHYVTLIGCAWWAGTQNLSWWAFGLLAFIAGSGSGLGINTGHELGHKHNKLEQWLARLVLAVPAYGHFTVEHGRGHHRWVATPDDHASARMGENIYRFALRELPGGMRRAWLLESQRLAQKKKPVWSVHNTLLQSYAVTLVLQLGLVAAFGWLMLPFLVIHNGVAWWQLTSANYVEHYGLLRQRLANGQFETPKPHHSWNTNHLVTNLALFQLQRHSDHHAFPLRRNLRQQSSPC